MIAEKDIARGLLSIEAVFLRPNEPFTWASGLKSPIYCDNRLTLSTPYVRTLIEQGLQETIQRYYPECELLMGTSTAGIPHAAITAQLMGLPMGYVRGSHKSHGRNNQIEGRLIPGQKTVVIEDLISTGGSSCETVDVLREAGTDVVGIASIFTYGLSASEAKLKEHSVVNHSLCTLDTLVDAAVDMQYITEDEKARILKFRSKPSDDSWMKSWRRQTAWTDLKSKTIREALSTLRI